MAHDGDVGNERADKLAKQGSKLRFELMRDQASSPNWFKKSLYKYWNNRRPTEYDAFA